MKYSAPISARVVASDRPCVVYSHTEGVISAHETIEEAREAWERHRASAAEWGHESDAMLFEWSIHEWVLCGTLYDAVAAEAVRGRTGWA